MSREQTYEVFRFIDYGAQCRQSLDCVEGSLLIYYLKEYPRVEKRCLFDWFGQLCHLLEQYQRCKRGQPYRYLNHTAYWWTGRQGFCFWTWNPRKMRRQ